MFESIVFYSLAVCTVVPALLVVASRNTVHSALWLGLSLGGVGGIFALLGADFLFGAQVMVYVGGIAVLIMFAVMLLGRASDLHLRQVNNQWLAGLLICAVSGVGLWRIARALTKASPALPAKATTLPIGQLMLGEYAVPFELVSLVLTAALLGAIFFSAVSPKGPALKAAAPKESR